MYEKWNKLVDCLNLTFEIYLRSMIHVITKMAFIELPMKIETIELKIIITDYDKKAKHYRNALLRTVQKHFPREKEYLLDSFLAFFETDAGKEISKIYPLLSYDYNTELIKVSEEIVEDLQMFFQQFGV